MACLLRGDTGCVIVKVPRTQLLLADSPDVIFVFGANVLEGCVFVGFESGQDVAIVRYLWDAVHVSDERCGPKLFLRLINDELCRDWVWVFFHVGNGVLLDFGVASWCVPMLLSSWVVCCEGLVVSEASGDCPICLVVVAWCSPVAGAVM